MLSNDMHTNQEGIQNCLRQQPVLVIENALNPEDAESLYEGLGASAAWAPQDTQTWKEQGIDVAEFTYSRNHIDIADQRAPDALKALNTYLNSKTMKQWFSAVSGRRCDKFIASATIFDEGDHISEHNDYYIYEEPGKPRYVRALTFNYYLSKNWNPDWGGNLVWKEPYQRISPNFNTLVLFNVTTNSHHWVEPVTKHPGEKRLSITGWFLTEIQTERFSLSL